MNTLMCMMGMVASLWFSWFLYSSIGEPVLGFLGLCMFAVCMIWGYLGLMQDVSDARGASPSRNSRGNRRKR